MTMTTGTETVTPASVNILRKTRYGTKNYSISVGFVKDGEMPQYVVLNNETGVVEFSHEVLSFAREWVNHFQQRLEDLDAGKQVSEDAVPPPANSFN